MLKAGVATAIMAATAPAFAQDKAAGTDTIVVTGSRIARPELESPNPIVVISSQDLQASGNVFVTDTLQQHPALVGSDSNYQAAGSQAALGGAGLHQLDLRNLGTDRTLVLVNGRRHVGSLAGSASVDINTIPSQLIEGVDILTGGASAIYGADGVSGVVNFRLKRDYEGYAVGGQIGIADEGDAGTRYTYAVAGKNFAGGRGNVALSYEYRGADRLNSFDRPHTGNPMKSRGFARNPKDFPDDPSIPDYIPFNDLRYADSSRNGAIDIDLDGIPDFTGDGKVYDRGTIIRGSGLAQGGDSTPVAGYQGDLAPKTDLHNVNLLASYEFSPAFRVFFEGKYVHSKNFTIAQPSFDFFTYLTPDNAFLQERFGPDAPDGALVSRDNYDLGIRGETAKRETVRTVLGVDGEISGNTRYELSYVFGQTKSRFSADNYRLTDRYYAALDAVVDPATGNIVCRSTLFPNANIDPNNYDGPAVSFRPGANSGCVPLNILGEGVASQEAIDWINVDVVNHAKLTQHVVSGSINGDFGGFLKLPGGPISYAVGAEYRKEKSSFRPDTYLQEGLLADIAQIMPETGSFDVKEVFAELNLPVLRDAKFAHLLSFGAAIRLSDYSTVGSTTTWKVDGTYAPIRDVMFRATYSEAVRAPNITELFSPQNGTYLFINDPCDPAYIKEGTQYREANCRAALEAVGLTPAQIASFNPENDPVATASLPGRSGGNPNLKEETAKTWTAGVVLRPSFIPGLAVSLDWYDIKLTNAVNTASAEELAELCVDQPSLDNVFCQNITRSSTTGYISDYLVAPQNVANFRTAGMDMTASYGFNISDKLGRINIRTTVGYLDRLEFIPSPGAEVDVDRTEAQAYAPKWLATGDITWTIGNVAVNWGVNWFSKTRRYEISQMEANPDRVEAKYAWVKEKWQHDLNVSYTFNKDARVYVGVNNVFDQKPDVGMANYPISTVGRSLYAGINLSF